MSECRHVSVSDGQRALGVVIHRDDGFEAISVAGHSVGIFHSEAVAATELWRHDRRLPATDKETRS
jgi:malonyl CoA-acyl carrier protein transacylase